MQKQLVKTLAPALCAAAAAIATTIPMSAEAKTYTTLDWIQGKSNAYLKSGYTPKSTDKIEMTLSFNDKSNAYGIFCARGSTTQTTSFTLFLFNQKFRIDHGNTSAAQVTSTFTPAVNTTYVVVADGNTQEFLVDGESYATMHDESFTPGSEMIFLASWTAGTASSLGNYATGVKLYGVRIWEASGALVCDFVPATDGTKCGLFNRVDKTFHASAGSAQFDTYGESSDPETYNLVEWQGGDATNPTDWNTAGNWSDGVPSAGDNVVIPSGVANMPVLAASTPVLGDIFVAGTLTMTNWTTCLNAATVTISSAGTLTSGAAVTNETDMSRVWINCTDLTIARGGKIDVNYKGYAGHPSGSDHVGYGPGAGDTKAANWGTAPSHGGHGARIPNGSYVLTNVMPYDNPAAPELPGSSGASGKWGTGRYGGGAVKIAATGAVVVNGSILANGQNASSYGTANADNHCPAGSGGSIFITCRTISGVGTLSANGGGGSRPNDAGHPAGGGMIAIHYDAEAEGEVSVSGMTITAAAGRYYQTGARAYESTNVDDNYDPQGINAGMGTVHFTDAQIARQIAGKTLTGNVLGVTNFVYDGDWSFTGGRVMFGEEGVKVTVDGDLALSGDDSRLEIGGGVTTNWCNSVVMYAGTTPSELTVTGDLTLGGVSRLDIRAAATNGIDKFGALVKVGGTMTISTNCFVYSWSDCQNLGSPHFEVGSLNVQTGGVFTAFGRGGRGSYHDQWTSFGKDMYGKGPGAARAAIAGGSHGGRGGKANANLVYDDELRPCMAGSGGSSYGNQWAHGGAGGGLIYVTATNGMIRVDGTIDASGVSGLVFDDGNGHGYGGGGSGGTIMLEAKHFLGGETGALLAKGGDTTPTSNANLRSGSGGGGRIAVWCGEPWEPGLKASKQVVSETPPTDNPEFFSYLGTYSTAGGEVLGDYGSDAQIGGDGTVRFCFVKGTSPTVMTFR